MDCTKVGKLIKRLRTEKKMTQAQLANSMNINDRTISKWERGLGCPDVSLLNELASALGINIEKLLSGDDEQSTSNGGNMRRIQFYVCNECGNIMLSLAKSELSCCGRKLSPLEASLANHSHAVKIEEIDGENYAVINHEMTKEHYISFAAIVGYERVTLIKLYPEQNPEFRFPKQRAAALYLYCNTHGLQKYQ